MQLLRYNAAPLTHSLEAPAGLSSSLTPAPGWRGPYARLDARPIQGYIGRPTAAICAGDRLFRGRVPCGRHIAPSYGARSPTFAWAAIASTRAISAAVGGFKSVRVLRGANVRRWMAAAPCFEIAATCFAVG